MSIIELTAMLAGLLGLVAAAISDSAGSDYLRGYGDSHSAHQD